MFLTLINKRIVLLLTIVFYFNNIIAQKKAEVKELKKIVYTLSADSMLGRSAGSIGEERAKKYLIKYLKKSGFNTSDRSLFQDFAFQKDSSSTDTATNIIAFLDNKKDSTIIISAHYDHIGFGGNRSKSLLSKSIHNGADDNASGVALMILLGDYFMKKKTIKYNFLFVAFSAHENGLFGSNAFANAKIIDLTKIKLLINIDMVGRLNDKAPILKIIKEHNYLDFLLKKNVGKKMNIVISDLDIEETDASIFVKNKVSAISLTTGIHDDYHKITDDAEKINYNGMYLIMEYLKNIISVL